ncbi:NADH:ubiquinone oxidoreductase [Malassezia sp. CBS 17886]|nr:NADH:ubiquinone oxidoreductase [Malassezia sp. CBS 17886]
MAGAPAFASAADEAAHWKAQVDNMQGALQEAETGLQEFMESSKELEAELEADVAQSAARVEALQAENAGLKCDADEWRGKYQHALAQHNATLADMHGELSKLRESHDTYKTKLRTMELDNDELENAERMINSSLADMEGKYNGAVEKTALLETELEAKMRLEEDNQRLKDELRDVREELAVLREQRPDAGASAPDAHPFRDASAGELTLNDLVVARPKPATDAPARRLRASQAAPRAARAATATTLERLRAHMQQLQTRLQCAQTPTPGRAPTERSALPRPRSSLSASMCGGGSPAWRHAPATPQRAEPPPSTTRSERRQSQSFIPVPTSGLSRSTSSSSRIRPSSRVGAADAALPYDFMGQDPALSSPVAATRRASATARGRRSVGGPSSVRPGSALRHADDYGRAASPTKGRASPTKIPWR